MTKEERNEQAYILLRQLLTKHFSGDGVEKEWIWRDGYTLWSVDRELCTSLLNIMPEVFQ